MKPASQPRGRAGNGGGAAHLGVRRTLPGSLADLEDTLRRAIVQVGDVARVLVVIELSLPALKARLAAGDKVQPAWGEFLARVASRYGLPAAPRLRYLTHDASAARAGHCLQELRMSLKNWMLGRMNRVFTRADLAPRDVAIAHGG